MPDWATSDRPPNNSLERTQPGRDIMSEGAMLRRSARGCQAAFEE